MYPLRIREVECHGQLRKADLGYRNKAHDFEHPTWEWVLKRKLPREYSEDSYRSSVVLHDIIVRSWDALDKPPNTGLTQEFSPDKEGEKAARSYDGQLLPVQQQTYERADLFSGGRH
jgi:hypothetical protein